MSKRFIAALVIVLVVGGLYLAMKVRAPRKPPPSTREVWAAEGVPVTVSATRIGDMEDTVEVTGDINALNKVTLSAKIPGRVARVLAREGDAVAQGATLIVLDQVDAEQNVEQAEAALETARLRLSQAQTTAKVTKVQTEAAIGQAKAALTAAEARLAVARKPARSQEEMVAENALVSAKANLENAEASFKRHEQLLEEGAISQAAFDMAKAQYAVAQSEYKSAGERLQMIKEGGRKEDVKAAEAQVNTAKEQLRTAKANASQYLLRKEDIKQAEAGVRQAEAALKLAQQQLSYTTVKSPIAGRLASRLTDPGQVVAAGQPLGDVVDLTSLYFKGDISEKELIKVKRGQPVAVMIDAIPGKSFKGSVSDIFPAGSTASRNFPVRIAISEGGERIRPGMFARGSIITGYARGVLLAPKDAIEERKGAKMVFTVVEKTVKTDKKSEKVYVAQRHDVEVVRENTHWAQIRTPVDLEPGDEVVTRGRQNLQDGTKVSVKDGV